MNRRTLLGGAAASAGLLIGSRLDRRHASAQGVSYVAESVYEFTESKEETYSPFSDGYFWGVTPDGTITGRDWVEGKLAPVTWDLGGTRSVLNTGDISFATTRNVVPGPPGYVVGNVAEADDPEAPSVGVLWTNGEPRLVESNPIGGVNASTVNSSGVVAGSMGSAAARWIDGLVAQLPLPEGADWSTIGALAENGDAFGYSYAADGGGITAFKWTIDGIVEEIPFPEEVFANGLIEVNSISFPGVFDDGSFVLSLGWNDASGYPSASWIYAGGTQHRVESSATNTHGRVSHAPSPSNMVGYINPGEGNPLGFIGPAQWLDGVPYSLETLTTLPSGIPLSSARGITDDGVIVATTFSFGSESSPAHILVLRPNS